jgi:hypothetical protein
MSAPTARESSRDFPRDFIDEEEGAAELLRESARLSRRALRRPYWVLGLTLLSAMTLTVRRARKQSIYRSAMVFRIVERMTEENSPSPPRQLERFINKVVFSSARLAGVLERFNLYPQKRQHDPLRAVEEMRDDLDLRVWRNYFISDQEVDNEEGRSARLLVGYSAHDPELSLAVTRALGRLITDVQEQNRLEQVRAARETLDQAAAESRDLLARHRHELLEKQLAVEHASPTRAALLRIEIANLLGRMKSYERQAHEYLRQRNDYALQEAVERNRLGLVFEVVDPGRVAKIDPLPRGAQLAIYGVTMFLVLLPLAGLLVGSLDPRIYQVEDLRRLGLRTVGEVPAFFGDGRLSLRERQRRDPQPFQLSLDGGS